MPDCRVHYSIVWELIEVVDVVAHNGARRLMFSGTARARRWRLLAAFVGGNISASAVLSGNTSTLASAGMTIDVSAGNVRPAPKIGKLTK